MSCQTIKITLKNEVLTHHGECQGTYETSALVNGKPSWTSQSTAIWYSQDDNDWQIGDLINIGTDLGIIYTDGMLLTPNKNGKWMYDIEEMWKELDTNDFSIECIARKGTY